MTRPFRFEDAFEGLTGFRPFPWQRRLFDEWLSKGKLPPAVDIPTGLGKTSVMAVWLLARAAGATLPRRLVYVVDRRVVVDQATEFAERLREALAKCNARLDMVRRGLGLCRSNLDYGDAKERLCRLPISTLRGRHVDNREWMADPAVPAIIVGTVDMVGSRLLFEGYGLSRRLRPYAAGLLGCDTLVMLDEAHLVRPFERLLKAIHKGQCVSSAGGADASAGVFAGSAVRNGFPPPLRMLSLSATLSPDSDRKPFCLDNDDKADGIVHTRLKARKSLTMEKLEKGSSLDDVLAEHAWGLMRAESASAEKSPSVAVYCDRRAVAEKVADNLRKRSSKEAPRPDVILFVGGRRVRERQEAAEELRGHGLIGDGEAARCVPVFLVATSAGEVGVDLDADHMVCDLVAWERMVQRLGRVNRRGAGAARVLVTDQGPPDGKTAGQHTVDRHEAVRRLLDALPRDETGAHQAGPAALVRLADNPALHKCIEAATTRLPLYPALTRPLVDAWAMTSLEHHAGRPEVGPWLRGWMEDEPQTTVVWRRYLPVRFWAHGDESEARPQREVRTFFAAAPPQTVELLETETWRVVEWLKKRASSLSELKAAAEPPTVPDDDDAEDEEKTVERKPILAPLNRNGPIAFLLDGANRPDRQEFTLSLAAIDERKPKELQASLVGKRLVVDARLGGIEEGMLKGDAVSDKPAATIEDNWGKRDDDPEEHPWSFKVEALPEVERETSHSGAVHASDGWQDMLYTPYSTSPEGEAVSCLIVQKRRGEGESEDARAVARKAQRLDEHQQWAGKEAERIAEMLGLGEADKGMLVAAARHHDNGKSARRWQQAFDAKLEGGPYAKTTSSPNQHRLGGFRHEFKSAVDAGRNGLDGLDRADPRFELALHLIAAHHGHARPAIGVGGYDDLPPSEAEASARVIALRFARLQRQWGPWGLAWWEALLRAADQAASKRLDEEAN